MYTKEWYKKEWQKAKKARDWYKAVYVIKNNENKELKARIENLEWKIRKVGEKNER